MRYGPELRGLQELEADARDTLEFDVNASRGAAEGIEAAIDAARPRTRRIYDQAAGSLADIDADLDAHGGLTGLFADATEREQAAAQGRVAESRAGALTDLASREVQAEEGRAFAVRNAISEYREKQDKLGRQEQGLRGDMAAFRLSTLEDLEQADRSFGLEEQRIKISERNAARQERATEADITGIDPQTGLPTAGELNRLRDDERAAAKERRRKERGGHTQGEITSHRSIVTSIQEARADAERGRELGFRWGEVNELLRRKRDEDQDSSNFNLIGGHRPLLSQAGVELARYGHLSDSTMRALRARGYLPDRAPNSWAKTPRGPSLTPRNRDGTPG